MHLRHTLLLLLLALPSLMAAQPARNEYLWGMNYLRAGNADEAIVCFYKAARRGNPDARYRLGLMYRDGVATERDAPGALRLFRRAAKQGNADAWRAMAELLYAGAEGVKQNRAEAAKCYEWLAAHGDSTAMFMLGGMNEYGDGVPKDTAKAQEYYARAAERGHAEAAYALAYLLETAGRTADASPYYRRAADAGLHDAAFNLALLLLDSGSAEAEAEGLRHLEAAADSGSAEAMNNLGSLYEAGRHVPQDATRAFALYRRASDSGLPEAQHNLGRFYLDGTATQPDARKALELFSKAAAQGLRAAQLSLARLYEDGAPGVPANPQKAMYWRGRAGK